MKIQYQNSEHHKGFEKFVCENKATILTFLEIGEFSKKFIIRGVFRAIISYVESIPCPESFSRDSDIGAGGIPPIPPGKP
jgi:hypothetical protein